MIKIGRHLTELFQFITTQVTLQFFGLYTLVSAIGRFQLLDHGCGTAFPSNLRQSDLTFNSSAGVNCMVGWLRLQHLVTFCLYCATQMFLLTYLLTSRVTLKPLCGAAVSEIRRLLRPASQRMQLQQPHPQLIGIPASDIRLSLLTITGQEAQRRFKRRMRCWPWKRGKFHYRLVEICWKLRWNIHGNISEPRARQQHRCNKWKGK